MIPFKETVKRTVPPSIMSEIYEMIKTPYKYGAVLKFEGEMCDSPVVFRHNDKWLMSFIKISNDVINSGYDSHLAESDDLLRWKYVCRTAARNMDNHWDSRQIALYAAFIENELYGKHRIQKVNGKYHFAILGGNLDGYETDPLSIGQCVTTDLYDPSAYKRFSQPKLRGSDIDARAGETLTLYKSNMFIDKALTTGFKYVNAYNAKGPDHAESIFLAVSQNGEDWERYGHKAIIFDETPDKCQKIIGDPQVLRYDDIYVAIYFVWQNGRAYNTFACSYDMIHWTIWYGKPLIESTEYWEDKYAHKPWLVVNDGVVYHFYCAVNKRGERFIALATSKRITPASSTEKS
jgi:predicted GH43/DUF377 family glycosyl hydrolase